MQWEEYYDNQSEDMNNETNHIAKQESKSEHIQSNEQGTYLTPDEFNNFINRLSGVDEKSGRSKAEISYQMYDVDEAQANDLHNQVYQLTNAVLRIYRNVLYPEFYSIDIIFKSCEDTELKLMWGRMQKHLKNQNEQSDKNWIFYINVLERASVTEQTETNDSLLTANIFNPVLCYLTREAPNMRASESIVHEELQGGSIIRMLVPRQLLTFDIHTDIDTNKIKGDVQRLEEETRYINATGE